MANSDIKTIAAAIFEEFQRQGAQNRDYVRANEFTSDVTLDGDFDLEKIAEAAMNAIPRASSADVQRLRKTLEWYAEATGAELSLDGGEKATAVLVDVLS